MWTSVAQIRVSGFPAGRISLGLSWASLQPRFGDREIGVTRIPGTRHGDMGSADAVRGLGCPVNDPTAHGRGGCGGCHPDSDAIPLQQGEPMPVHPTLVPIGPSCGDNPIFCKPRIAWPKSDAECSSWIKRIDQHVQAQPVGLRHGEGHSRTADAIVRPGTVQQPPFDTHFSLHSPVGRGSANPRPRGDFRTRATLGCRRSQHVGAPGRSDCAAFAQWRGPRSDWGHASAPGS